MIAPETKRDPPPSRFMNWLFAMLSGVLLIVAVMTFFGGG